MDIPGLGSGTTSRSEDASTSVPHHERRTHFAVIRFVYEAGTKLELKPVPISTAAHLYHRVFDKCQFGDFDPYLIGATCLYLASKITEDHRKLRDVINVSYRCLHKTKMALDIGSTYWALRDSIVQCELFIMRLLKFQVVQALPHSYLLHYLESLATWLLPETIANIPYPRTAWALLRDSYHGDVCLHYPADWIAVSVLYFALQIHGVEVPYSDEAEYRWWEALVEDMKLTDIRKIITQIISAYELENTVSS